MSSRVEAAAAPYRDLAAELGKLEQAGTLAFEACLGRSGHPQRSMRLIAGITAIHAALEGSAGGGSSALSWFLGAGDRDVSGRFDTVDARGLAAAIQDHLVALLPYVLDPFGLTTRRALIAGRGSAHERGSRKRHGTFYTPGDVARSLVRDVITPDTRHILDPACGAGVFLRAAFTRLAAVLPPDRAVERLYGIDTDATAIDACSLVLLHDWLAREALHAGEAPVDRFRTLSRRLIHADALQLFAEPFQLRITRESGLLPKHFPQFFDAVLTNPPFARIGDAPQRVTDGFASLRATRNPRATNMAWPFWEIVSRVVGRNGRVGIVLPLSAAYAEGNSPRAARDAAFSRGRWELRFFDRTPDSLFGDDVKQRVAIAVRRPSQSPTIRVTALRRWSADSRDTALYFDENDGVDIPVTSSAIPKIGSGMELEAIRHLCAQQRTLGDCAVTTKLVAPRDLDDSNCAIAVAPTAYNWLGVYRDTSVAWDGRRNAKSKLVAMHFASPRLADAAYGVLVSHIFLWWWRATGDLFHVPLRALAHAPFPIPAESDARLADIAAAGRACWKMVSRAPRIAVNRGVKTVAYSAAPDLDDLERIDAAVGATLGLSPRFVRFARDDASRLQTAGRIH